MACGKLSIEIVPPTMGRTKFTEHQMHRLEEIATEFIGQHTSGSDLSYIRSRLELEVRHFGWLDGGVKVEDCGIAPPPLTSQLEMKFQIREELEGNWSDWHNGMFPSEDLPIGGKYQMRVSRGGDIYSSGNWRVGPVLSKREDDATPDQMSDQLRNWKREAQCG